MRRLKYLTVSLRRLPRVNALNEEVVNRVAAVVDNEVDEGGLRRVKLWVFRPPTSAVFECRLEVQIRIEVDSEHAKVMFQINDCTGKSMRNYLEVGGKQTQDHDLPTVSLALVDLICLRGRQIT